MKYALTLVLALFGCVGFAGAEEWKEVGRLETAQEITWVDVDQSGDQVLYVCDWHDAYLYTAEKGKPIPINPQTDRKFPSQTGFTSIGLFLQKEWYLYGGFGKYHFSSIGTKEFIVPKNLPVKKEQRRYGVPHFAFVKGKNSQKALLYLPPVKKGEPEQKLGSFVFMVRPGQPEDSAFVHSRDERGGTVAIKLEAVAISPDSDFVFTAGSGLVVRWITGPKKAPSPKSGSFGLPPGTVAAMAATKDVVAVAMANGSVQYSVDMQRPQVLPIDTTVAVEKSPNITNHSLAMSDDGQSIFLSRTRLTNKSQPVDEVVVVGPDQPYKQLLAREAAITQVKLADEHTLVCLDAAGWLGFLSLESGSAPAEPTWLKTGVPDATTLSISGGGTTVVVSGSKTIDIYQRVGKEKLAAK